MATKKKTVKKATRSKTSGLTLLKKSTTRYPDSPDKAKLETFDNQYADRDYEINFQTEEFSSLCPITGQPDFATISITYIPDQKCVESKSLKLYLFSYRNFNTFYEEAVNRILDDLVKVCKPRWAIVSGMFSARGGIESTVTAEHPQD